MLRAFRGLFIILFVGLMFANCDQLKADTYEVGPFQVIGVGMTRQEAMADAYGQAYDWLMTVHEMLPEGDEIIQLLREYHAFGVPTIYFFEFSAVVQEADPVDRGEQINR